MSRNRTRTIFFIPISIGVEIVSTLEKILRYFFFVHLKIVVVSGDPFGFLIKYAISNDNLLSRVWQNADKKNVIDPHETRTRGG